METNQKRTDWKIIYFKFRPCDLFIYYLNFF